MFRNVSKSECYLSLGFDMEYLSTINYSPGTMVLVISVTAVKCNGVLSRLQNLSQYHGPESGLSIQLNLRKCETML